MKKLLLTLLILLSAFFVKAQYVLAEAKGINHKNILSNLYDFKKYDFKTYLIRVYSYDNGSGSAQVKGSDESTSSILISKVEYGEAEVPRFYVIPYLLNFKIKAVKENQIEIEDTVKKKTVIYRF